MPEAALSQAPYADRVAFLTELNQTFGQIQTNLRISIQDLASAFQSEPSVFPGALLAQ